MPTESVSFNRAAVRRSGPRRQLFPFYSENQSELGRKMAPTVDCSCERLKAARGVNHKLFLPLLCGCRRPNGCRSLFLMCVDDEWNHDSSPPSVARWLPHRPCGEYRMEVLSKRNLDSGFRSTTRLLQPLPHGHLCGRSCSVAVFLVVTSP
jgi:hypothetical protein